VLRRVLPQAGLVLEVASGPGEHAAWFAARLAGLRWQPSGVEGEMLASIEAWRAAAPAPNLLAPLRLDVASDPWPIAAADAVVCINLAHVAPWQATLGLLRGAARVLAPGAPLYLYGPWLRRAGANAPSNVAFDRALRARHPDWGLRAVEDLRAAAAAHGLDLTEEIEMPSHNLSLILRRRA